MSADRPNVICLMGPTASGKTAAAIALAERLPVDVVSVDASQVYRGMDIGTAKPTQEELARAPHRLIDIRNPDETYSAAEFCTDATREIERIVAQGRLPLLVGGTMFYFHAFEFGLSSLPSADPAVREQLQQEADEKGWPAMHERLASIDPASARRIAPQDAQRIQRALEIWTLSGKTPTSLAAERPRQEAPYRFIKIALLPENRESLHERINRRFDGMLARGLVEEVEGLLKRYGLETTLPSMRIVGYRQVGDYLRGSLNYVEMGEQAKAATRQLAKRQLTWLRNYPGIRAWSIDDAQMTEQIQAYIETQAGIQG